MNLSKPTASHAQGGTCVSDTNMDGTGSPVRCVSCVLSRSVRGLSFDDAGVCDLCNAHAALQETARPRAEHRPDIEAVIQTIRDHGKNRKYDCLVGISGGRDSCYLLYLLVRKHKLRCLATHYRPPFTDDVIEENVHRAVSRLGVPLVRIGLSQEYHRNYARKVLLLWKKKQLHELVNLLCAPCKYLHRELLRVARRHNIKSLMLGGNKFEVFQLGVAHAPTARGRHRHAFGSQAIKSLLLAKRGISLVAKCPSLLPLIPTGAKAAILYINPHTPYLRLRYPDILRWDYFFHEEYDEAECVNVVTSELGWELPPGCNSGWRADCSIAELKNLLFRQGSGASYIDTYLSNMVRSGDISRDEALARLAREGKVSEHRLEHVARVLEVELDFLEREV